MAEPKWTLQDAKNKFSAVVDAALKGTPQHVTRRGQPAVVVVSAGEFERLRGARKPSFKEMLLAMPKGDFEIERSKAPILRKIEFEE
jgi:prevent-host-death family protein